MNISIPAASKRSALNRRAKLRILAGAIFVLLITIYISGMLLGAGAMPADFSQKALPPSGLHPFGTDMLGRDMLTRTVRGLSLSLFVGAAASFVSAFIALTAGIASASGKAWLDHMMNWLIDLTMSVPHTVLVILISIAAGRGMRGLLIGIALTHWTGLARIIRGEVLQIRSKQYIATSRKLGKPRIWIIIYHIFPHMIPQFFIGLVLMFPHAVMHESGITFLGFGLSPEQPAIGVILAESMRYLSGGMWWLAFFPGLSLAIVVVLIDQLGECFKKIL